jgi:hypothetical protein
MRQPTFFDKGAGDDDQTPDAESIVLHALGEFQARGKVLADRELPLDRLRGALRRACDARGVPLLTDEQAAAAFAELGAHVRRVASFVAKHPFRVNVPPELAARAREFFDRQGDEQS